MQESALSILERSFRPYVLPSRGGECVGTNIYLLVRDRRIVYVGATGNLQYRISNHTTEMRRLDRGAIEVGKRFDRALFMPLPGRDKRLFEVALIRELRPEYNKKLNNPMPTEAAALYWLGLRDELTDYDIFAMRVA